MMCPGPILIWRGLYGGKPINPYRGWAPQGLACACWIHSCVISMSEVRFYHLTTAKAEQALPQLLEKTLARQKTAVVKLADEDAVHHWNEYLWAYGRGSFLPHGSIKDADLKPSPFS